MTTLTQKRQTCWRCLRTVGLLPSGEARPYITEVQPNGRRFHHCQNRPACNRARSEREAKASALTLISAKHPNQKDPQ